jgi:hypothetical protein
MIENERLQKIDLSGSQKWCVFSIVNGYYEDYNKYSNQVKSIQ